MDKIVLIFCVALSVLCYGDVLIKCGQNERKCCVYDYPPQKTCDNYNVTCDKYSRDETEKCKNKCICNAGYYRNYLNECISEANCAKCSRANEFFTCGPECDNECKNLSDNRTHCSIQNVVCNRKCYCKDGYARNNNRDCVPVSQCSSKLKCNRLNEEKKYVFKCPPERTCDNRFIMFNCLRNETEVKEEKCVCKAGYYRNYLRECISKEDCDKCTGDNEFYTCGSACDNKCDNPKYNRTHCNIINIKCNNKCYCKDGYARDAFNKCIPVKNCNQPVCNKPNEKSVCVYKCPPEKTCDNRKVIYECASNKSEMCQYKCRCKEGYYRNYLNECISKANCEKCSKDNEFFTCGPECDNRCASLDTNNRTNCDIINIKCNEKCYCKDGFARDDFGNCIPVKKCIKCTGDNEFYTCGSACDNKCDNPKYNRTHCNIVNKKCNNKCYCKDGYARDAFNKCIPVKNCNKLVCSQPNEKSVCVYKCPPEKTCDNRKVIYECASNKSEMCQYKCRCKEGYYRNYLNECISKVNCEKCSKDNEFFTCGPECDNRCASLDTSNRTNCDIINIKCNEKCYCKDGFARDDFGNCIPIKKCNQPVCNQPNEESVCVYKCPPEKTCDNRNVFYKCASNKSEMCQYKCRCKEGYYRNYLNECISKANCEKCSKDNEFFTCGPECDNRCASLDTSNRTNCDIINIKCNEKCYCKDGFARDEFGSCIPVKKCNESCKGPHEVYMKCKKTCPPDTCISLVALYNCSNVTCKTDGCICQENFKRQKPNSPCIPTKQCRPQTIDDRCKGHHEVYYSKCKPSCPLLIIIDCTRVNNNIKCKPGCTRQENFKRPLANTFCMPIDQYFK